jgi:hypothetical protein
MNAVKINRLQLLDIVRENLIKHISDYNEAVDDYKALAIKIAKENTKIARDNLKLVEAATMDKLVAFKAMPAKPTSYETEYKRAIRMIDLSVEDVIEVEEDVFNQLVLDEWSWKRAFTTSNAMYKSGL